MKPGDLAMSDFDPKAEAVYAVRNSPNAGYAMGALVPNGRPILIIAVIPRRDAFGGIAVDAGSSDAFVLLPGGALGWIYENLLHPWVPRDRKER